MSVFFHTAVANVQEYLPSFQTVYGLSGKMVDGVAKIGIVASLVVGTNIILKAADVESMLIGSMLTCSGCAISATVLGVKAALTSNKIEALKWLAIAASTGLFAYQCDQLVENKVDKILNGSCSELLARCEAQSVKQKADNSINFSILGVFTNFANELKTKLTGYPGMTIRPFTKDYSEEDAKACYALLKKSSKVNI